MAAQPWLRDAAEEPLAARDPPPAPTRLRPLIYIYDLDPLYNSRLLQYRRVGVWQRGIALDPCLLLRATSY